ncbi:DedA family protein [Noviherbaspirillum aerium]|uniref:DedA family protein n=1 Tax=Noviherbaspirillum aerium TaxID=2588497 RepID=UPI00124CBAE6|nr:DedA family protein [Noviherbaspirillum aerium]
MFEFIVNFMAKGGYLAVFALMALENIFPPMPSEMIMPLAGFTAARGDLNVIGVLLVGTAGSVAGTLPWYYLGKLYGKERVKHLANRHGRWLTISADDVGSALQFFLEHGGKAVFLGRLIPAIRTLISIPAGIAEMSLVRFLLYSTAGSMIWTGLLTAAGVALKDQYEMVATYVDPVTKTVLGLIVAVYLYRLVTYRRAS